LVSFLPINQTIIREWLGMKNTQNYTQEIRKILKNLAQPIELKNYEEDGEQIRWGIKHLIKDVDEKKDYDNKTILYNITIDTFLFETILNLKDNFTKIDFRENIKKVLEIIIQ
jgi:hypothetical protein